MTQIVWENENWIFLEIGGSKEMFASTFIEEIRFSKNLAKTFQVKWH